MQALLVSIFTEKETFLFIQYNPAKNDLIQID